MNSKDKYLFYSIIALSLIGFLLRVLFLWKHSTAFTYDQGRDLLEIREMVVNTKLRLIGPTTSLHGVFSGPTWYYLALPFYLLSNGHPLSTICPLLILALALPMVIFYLVSNKQLGFLLALFYVVSNVFFRHSVIALNTNPMVFLTPIILILLARFFDEGNKRLFYLAMFLAGLCFHFEIVVAIFWLPIFLISAFSFKKLRLVLESWPAIFVFILPFVPQMVFDLRHNFLQSRAILALILGQGSSLTLASGGMVFRFFDRVRIFKEVFWVNSGETFFLSLAFASLVIYLIVSLLYSGKRTQKEEFYYLVFINLFSLAIIFFGFVFYPYAIWPWYLGAVDGLITTLMVLGLFFFLGKGRKVFYLSASLILIIFILIQVSQYLPWPLKKKFSSDPANLRTRLRIVDLIYNDAKDRGMKIYTFAPYVYDYPYQYLIWWRAKTKHGFLPEDFSYLPNQPSYVPAKERADAMISIKKAECDYLIIEPFESQEKWFWDWRYRFPEAKQAWQVGLTKVEKLCQK